MNLSSMVYTSLAFQFAYMILSVVGIANQIEAWRTCDVNDRIYFRDDNQMISIQDKRDHDIYQILCSMFYVLLILVFNYSYRNYKRFFPKQDGFLDILVYYLHGVKSVKEAELQYRDLEEFTMCHFSVFVVLSGYTNFYKGNVTGYYCGNNDSVIYGNNRIVNAIQFLLFVNCLLLFKAPK